MITGFERKDVSAAGLAFAIVVSRWNEQYTSKLAGGAKRALLQAGSSEGQIDTFSVPGAFELPVASLKAARSGRYDAVIALGVVIRGDTPHFDYVAGQAAAGLMQASMQTGVPVMFGVITADNVEQVVERSGNDSLNKGFEAAVSAVETVAVLRDIESASATAARVV